jgi:hypothetical protein
LQLFEKAHFCDHDLLSFAHQLLQFATVGAAVGDWPREGAMVGAGGGDVAADGAVVGRASHSAHFLFFFCDHDLLSFAHQALQFAVGAGGTGVGAADGGKGAVVGAAGAIVVRAFDTNSAECPMKP